MKKRLLTGIFALIGLIGAQNVHGETWCLRNFGEPPDKNCVSAPLQYCLRGLAAGGGICARDQSRFDQSDYRSPSRPSARRLGKNRSDW
jgi:hypothetical protein